MGKKMMFCLNIKNEIPGRAVGLSSDGHIFLGRNYELFTADISGNCEQVAVVPCPAKQKFIAFNRLLCRLFRHEIRGAVTLSDNSKVVATRQGLYCASPDDIVLTPAKLPQLTPEVILPTAITADSEDRILWGEYWGNSGLRSVRLFVSHDKGRSYEPFFSFRPGEIKHVHNIVEDTHDDCYWVLVGDHFHQSGIGRLSKDLKTFDWLIKGEQKYRAVCVFPLKERLVYATDSEKEPNCVCSLNKAVGKWEKICDVPGSCIYAARFGKWYAISTTSECFDFETIGSRMATLWVSSNCEDWQQVFAVDKDIWNKKYFQFGSLVLPRGQWDNNEIVFSGQAVKKYDNVTCIAEIVEE
jgi:hypothetical protein